MFLDSCRCSWCDREINEYNLEGFEIDNKQDNNNCEHKKVIFCNFICARHYNDLIHKIYIDINGYNELFKNNKLDNVSAKIFIKISKTGFEFMPLINNNKPPNTYKERIRMCRKYLKDIYEM